MSSTRDPHSHPESQSARSAIPRRDLAILWIANCGHVTGAVTWIDATLASL
jgi:hypothetical protein